MLVTNDMQVFGLEPIILAILITAAGTSLSVILGWLKSDSSFNVKQVVASALIAFVVSAQLVIAQLELLPPETSDLALGAILFGLIAQVAGIDSLAKSAVKAAVKTKKP